jgi:RND superfamily putative drug exporter
VNPVLRHPAISTVVSAALLVAIAAAVMSAISGLSAAAVASHLGYGVNSVDTDASHTVARVRVPLPGNGVDTTSTNALLTLRNQLLPQTIGRLRAPSTRSRGRPPAAMTGPR